MLATFERTLAGSLRADARDRPDRWRRVRHRPARHVGRERADPARGGAHPLRGPRRGGRRRARSTPRSASRPAPRTPRTPPTCCAAPPRPSCAPSARGRAARVIYIEEKMTMKSNYYSRAVARPPQQALRRHEPHRGQPPARGPRRPLHQAPRQALIPAGWRAWRSPTPSTSSDRTAAGCSSRRSATAARSCRTSPTRWATTA